MLRVRRARRRWSLLALGAVVFLLGGGLVARSAFAAGDRHAPLATPSRATTIAPVSHWVTTSASIVSGGLTRTYLVAERSPAPTTTVPVVVVLHGSSVTPAYEEQRTGLRAVVGSAILVYPAGYGETWNAGHCCGAAHAAGLNDEAFITSVVAQVLAQHPEADASKVDLVGYSNGGRLAWSLACDDPGVFHAVAVYGAVLDKTCSRLGPISGLEIAGLSDPELTVYPTEPATVSDGFTEPTVTAQAAQLRADDGCQASSVVVTTGRAVTTTWSNCGGGRRVALTLYQGQNHTWPAGGGTTPSAETLIWRFFQSLGST